MRFFLFIYCLLVSLTIYAEDKDLAKVFKQHHVNGTIIISSLSGQDYIYNQKRAKQRFTIASTFKILNSLIALEEKVTTQNEVLVWNGQHYDIASWNQNHTLESAFKASCVWCYQALAKRVGMEKYRDYLNKIHYGVLTEPFETTTFWLDGALKVSALDQIEFLKNLYLHRLPFSAATYDTVKHIMIVEQTPDYTLRAKTGWATQTQPQIGWYVGYLETKHDVWFFATNLDIQNKEQLPLRQQVTQQALQTKGILRAND